MNKKIARLETPQKDYEDGDGDAGVCPYCGNLNLDYGEKEIDATGLFYPWICPKCKHKGVETYIVEFSGHYHT